MMKRWVVGFGAVALLLAGCNMYNKQVYALGNAARDGNIGEVKALVSAGVNVNGCVGYEGCDKPIDFAARKGHLSVVRFLVEHGATINTEPQNAVFWSARYGKADVVHYLLSHGGRLICDQSNLAALKRDMTSAGWVDLEAEVVKTWVEPS